MIDKPPLSFAAKHASLGFGCSALAGAGRRDADRLIAVAFEAGVRHFDVARYYGYGDAEGILAKFLKGHRSEVTITTKFGIEPPRKTPALAVALRWGRRVAHLAPALRGILQRRAQSLVTGGAFGVEQARASLATSLRELGTQHIDFYLLHDYSAGEQLPDKLIEFLDESVQSGKIGAYGVGTGIENVLQVLARQPCLGRVVQFGNSVLTRNVERLPADTTRRVFTHGALGGSYCAILKLLEARKSPARDWAAKLGCERLDQNVLSSLMLNYAVAANPGGMVLFSSRDPARVARNVKAVLESPFSPAQITLFETLVKQELAIMTADSAVRAK